MSITDKKDLVPSDGSPPVPSPAPADEGQAPINPLFDSSGNPLPTQAQQKAQLPAHAGKWKPGQSGNPLGKPKGTKNFNTKLQEAMEGGLRLYLADPQNHEVLLHAMDRVLRIAAYGADDKNAVSAFRVLADKLLTSPKPDVEQQQAPPSVTIKIENATVRPTVDAVEAEFTEVTKEK